MRIHVRDHERLKITIFGRGAILKSFVKDCKDFPGFPIKATVQYGDQDILTMLQNFDMRYNCAARNATCIEHDVLFECHANSFMKD